MSTNILFFIVLGVVLTIIVLSFVLWYFNKKKKPKVDEIIIKPPPEEIDIKIEEIAQKMKKIINIQENLPKVYKDKYGEKYLETNFDEFDAERQKYFKEYEVLQKEYERLNKIKNPFE